MKNIRVLFLPASKLYSVLYLFHSVRLGFKYVYLLCLRFENAASMQKFVNDFETSKNLLTKLNFFSIL
jgi:hypothetical protein